MIVVLLLMFMIAAAAPRMLITIPSGHAGVLWLRFFGGTVTKGPALGEGLHIIFPWDRIFIYDMRTQAEQKSYEVISKDGLHFDIAITMRWHLLRRTLPHLQQQYGPNYVNVLLAPEIGSVARDKISQYPMEDVYSFQRKKIQDEIYDAVVSDERTNAIGPTIIKPEDYADYVSMTDLLITKMTLPTRIRGAIESKLEQLLKSEEYTYRLATERQEAQRKEIEAGGIRAFQQTVQQGITPSYLKWRGIEATLQLAQSPNAKVVVIGGGSQGLPLILNTGDTPPPSPSAAAAPAAKTAAPPAMSPMSTTPPMAAAAPLIDPPPAADEHAPSAPPTKTRPAAMDHPADEAEAVPQLVQDLVSRLGYRLVPVSPPAAPPHPAGKPQ